MSMRHGSKFAQIDHAQQWVGRRLDVDHFGFGSDLSLEIFEVARVRVLSGDSGALQYLGKQAAGATIQIVVGKNLLAVLQQFGRSRDGGHAAGKAISVGAVFQRRNLFFDYSTGRVAAARIIVLAKLIGKFLLEGCGLIDRGRDGAEAISWSGIETYQAASEFHGQPLSPGHYIRQLPLPVPDRG